MLSSAKDGSLWNVCLVYRPKCNCCAHKSQNLNSTFFCFNISLSLLNCLQRWESAGYSTWGSGRCSHLRLPHSEKSLSLGFRLLPPPPSSRCHLMFFKSFLPPLMQQVWSCVSWNTSCVSQIFFGSGSHLRVEGRIWPGRPSGASVLMNPSISRLANTILPTIHNRFWPNPSNCKRRDNENAHLKGPSR